MKQTVKDVDVRGKRVLIRVDFNVPLDKASGRITDDTRIRESLPTIRYCLEQGAAVILMSHLGRPDGKRTPALSLRPVAIRLGELLKRPVVFLEECVGAAVEARVKSLRSRVGQLHGYARVNGRLVVDGTMTFALGPPIPTSAEGGR